MKILGKIAVFVLLLAALWPTALRAQGADPFQYTVDLSVRRMVPGGSTPVELTLLIPPLHHLYKNKTRLTLSEGPESDGFELGPVEMSPSHTMKDPFTGADEEIFEETATLKTQLRAKPGAAEGERSAKLILEYQGCSDKLCYRLMRKELTLPVALGSARATSDSSASFLSDPLAALRKRGLFVALLVAFAGGLASAFTPCVLPIIPITLAFIGVRKQGTGLGKNFVLSLFLVLSMSLTYAMMGLMASLLGKSLGFLFQSPYFLSFGVLLYVALSLSLFGLFEIQAPMGMRNFLAKLGGKGILGSILSGFTVGFLAAPCVGPVIASLLLYVAKERDAVHGFSLLFAYGLGMGSLFLAVGTFYHRLASKVHGGPFTVWIKRVFAVLLLVPALYYGSVVYAQLTGKSPSGLQEVYHSFWIRSSDEGFRRAQETGRPIFMDFFASWCLPCVKMENGTFSDEGLQKFLTESFVPVKIDCTEETPDCKAMVEKFGVVGWPTFLVMTPEGIVLQTMIGQELSPGELEERLKEIR